MAKKTRSGVWRCKGGFATPIDGLVVTVPDGALVPYQFGYEVMDGREHLFEDIGGPRQVEQATSEPGEKRTVRRRSGPVDAAPEDAPAGG